MIDLDTIELIELDLTTICNARCPLCYRNTRNFSGKYRKAFYRSYDEIATQILSFRNLKTVYLIGQLSEPTTHPEFLKILAYVKSLDLTVKICTNGDLHDDSFWRELGGILSDEDEVWFTLCGSTQDMHEHYRVNTSLERILHHAEALRSVRKIDCAKCLRFRYNQEDIESRKFADIVKDFSKVERLDTCHPLSRESYNYNFTYDDLLPVEDVLQEYRKIDTMSKFYNSRDPSVYCQSIEEKSL